MSLKSGWFLAHDDFPGSVGEDWEWYPFQRSNSVPPHLLKIQTTPPHGYPALVSALEPTLVVTMPGVAETFQTVIDEMTDGTDLKLFNLLHAANHNLTQKELNTRIDQPDNQCNIHLVWYHTLPSRVQPTSNGQLSHCAWSFAIFDEFHQYMTKNSVGWQIAINARIGFKLQVTAMPGFHSR